MSIATCELIYFMNLERQFIYTAICTYRYMLKYVKIFFSLETITNENPIYTRVAAIRFV
jgi:hypothetical protein